MMNELNEVAALKSILAAPVTTRSDAERAARAAELIAEHYEWAERANELVTGGAERSTSGDLAGLPLHDAARRVLADAGVPLHATELGRRIKAAGWRHPRSKRAGPNLIVFQLAAQLPKRPDVFRRVAPNTFALVEWGDAVAPSEGPKPRGALFRGPGKPIGELIGESDEPYEQSPPWRSS